MANSLNLDEYLARVEYQGPLTPTIALLRDLHLAHATHIPFENIDVLLGKPIALDLPSLTAKLVTNRRGGYCFEQNTLFAAVLEQIGFTVTCLGARVRLGSTRVAPRTHMLLRVEAEDTPFLADVGFGGGGFLDAIPLAVNAHIEQFGWSHRLEREGELWVLKTKIEGVWIDQYSFTLEPQYPSDYEVANYYTSTHPTSIFRQILVAQAQSTRSRISLHNSTLIEATSSGSQISRKLGEHEILSVLADRFGLHLPTGTHVPIAPPRA
jgi:N-hydroxyarylamine O-acetyltransferase